MSLNPFFSQSKFYDDKNFPYGFQRSGHFTVTEAECLMNCGLKMNQLAEQKISPEREEEKHFLLVLEGKAEPLNDAEKAYVKYRKILAEKSVFVRSVTKPDRNNTDSDYVDENDED